MCTNFVAYVRQKLGHKCSASEIEETELENLCSNLPLLGSAQLLTLVALDVCVLDIPEGVLQRVISQASTANV